MAAEREVKLLRPRAHERWHDSRGHRAERTGLVSLPVVLSYLASEPITDATMTPDEAADLAGELLAAAKVARQHRSTNTD